MLLRPGSYLSYLKMLSQGGNDIILTKLLVKEVFGRLSQVTETRWCGSHSYSGREQVIKATVQEQTGKGEGEGVLYKTPFELFSKAKKIAQASLDPPST